MNINTMTFAARDFSARRGASDEHIPKWICEERATKFGRKRTAARRVAPNLTCGVVARRLQPHLGDAPVSKLAQSTLLGLARETAWQVNASRVSTVFSLIMRSRF